MQKFGKQCLAVEKVEMEIQFKKKKKKDGIPVSLTYSSERETGPFLKKDCALLLALKGQSHAANY